MRLLILGTGSMAHNHAMHFSEIKEVTIVAAVDINLDRLQAFGKAYSIPHLFMTLEEAIAWGEFDAVANTTPDASHYTTTLQALTTDKHVFCEKPLATNYADALAMVAAAQKSGKVGMVNLSYRNIAELALARDMICTGMISRPRHVEASYLQSWLISKYWSDWRHDPAMLWRLSTKHGSNGVLGDVGIHILDFVNYGTNLDIDVISCCLKSSDKSMDKHIGDYDLDANDSFVMTASFSNGALGVIHASRWATGHINELKLRVYGDKDGLELRHWHEGTSLAVCMGADIDDASWQEVKAPAIPTTYQCFVDAVLKGETKEPSFGQAAKIQRLIDIGMNSK